jgi:hypothetical protein
MQTVHIFCESHAQQSEKPLQHSESLLQQHEQLTTGTINMSSRRSQLVMQVTNVTGGWHPQPMFFTVAGSFWLAAMGQAGQCCC